MNTEFLQHQRDVHMTKDNSGITTPTRRTVLQTAAAAAAGVTAAASATFKMSAAQARGGDKKKPNILVILPDQYRYDAVGSVGMPVAKTPNFDKIAAGGTRFSTTWVQS